MKAAALHRQLKRLGKAASVLRLLHLAPDGPRVVEEIAEWEDLIDVAYDCLVAAEDDDQPGNYVVAAFNDDVELGRTAEWAATRRTAVTLPTVSQGGRGVPDSPSPEAPRSPGELMVQFNADMVHGMREAHNGIIKASQLVTLQAERLQRELEWSSDQRRKDQEQRERERERYEDMLDRRDERELARRKARNSEERMNRIVNAGLSLAPGLFGQKLLDAPGGQEFMNLLDAIPEKKVHAFIESLDDPEQQALVITFLDRLAREKKQRAEKAAAAKEKARAEAANGNSNGQSGRHDAH